jgi:hypothetical protein
MIRVDSFLLADAGQVVSGKLSLLGAGWNNLTVRNPDGVVPLIVVAGRIVVPATEARNVHELTIQLFDDEANSVLESLPRLTIAGIEEEEEEAGTPKEYAVPFAIDIFGFAFPRQGEYAFTIARGDEELARTNFRVRFRN